MKKKYFYSFFIFGVLSCSQIHAQNVSINSDGTAPDPSALLDVMATDKGMLVPRMNSVQKTAIASPAIGLLIYQTDAPIGFWYYDAIAWKPVSVQLPAAINFRYYASTSQSINASTNTKVNFGTQSFLNNANFSNSTFTAPAAGLYHFSVYLYIYGNSAGNLNVSLLVNNINKSGTSFNIVSAIFQGVGFSDNLVLAAGDQVFVQVNSNSSMAVSVGNATYFTAFKIN